MKLEISTEPINFRKIKRYSKFILKEQNQNSYFCLQQHKIQIIPHNLCPIPFFYAQQQQQYLQQ